MGRGKPGGSSRREWIALVAAFAFVLRAAIPAGWMPGDHGVIPCFGHTVERPMAPHQGHGMAGSSHEAGGDTCPYAATAFAWFVPFVPVPAPAAFMAIAMKMPDVVEREQHRAFAGTPRGPPPRLMR